MSKSQPLSGKITDLHKIFSLILLSNSIFQGGLLWLDRETYINLIILYSHKPNRKCSNDELNALSPKEVKPLHSIIHDLCMLTEQSWIWEDEKYFKKTAPAIERLYAEGIAHIKKQIKDLKKNGFNYSITKKINIKKLSTFREYLLGLEKEYSSAVRRTYDGLNAIIVMYDPILKD